MVICARRVSINPEPPTFLVFSPINTRDHFFEDPSTTAILGEAALPDDPISVTSALPLAEAPPQRRVLVNQARPAPLTDVGGGCGWAARGADDEDGAGGGTEMRLMQEIENMSINELKDKIREVTMKRRQRQRRQRALPHRPATSFALGERQPLADALPKGAPSFFVEGGER